MGDGAEHFRRCTADREGDEEIVRAQAPQITMGGLRRVQEEGVMRCKLLLPGDKTVLRN